MARYNRCDELARYARGAHHAGMRQQSCLPSPCVEPGWLPLPGHRSLPSCNTPPPLAAAVGAPSAHAGSSSSSGAAPGAPVEGPIPRAAVHRGVPYGARPRNFVDVYVPVLPQQPAASPQGLAARPSKQHPQPQQQPAALRPVVFFVHGGVWASGEPWHYAPMAQRLVQEGCVVVVPAYTLYPEALAGG